MVSRLVVPLALMVALALGAPLGLVSAQIDPQVRDRVVPAIVAIAIVFDVTDNGVTDQHYLPVGSGTLVSGDGFILTNHHVIDMDAHRAQLQAWEAQAQADGDALTFTLDRSRVLVLGTQGASLPEPRYAAELVAHNADLDLAVLRVTSDAGGQLLDTASLALPFVPLGDSTTVQQGDPIDLWGYPMIGGGTLTYTAGVVSGFNFEEGMTGAAWIITDATMSGGSSGGAALDRAGRLIGVPTQGSSLDCRPGDMNGDGRIDAQDVGCVPTGGSIGQVRPIHLVIPLLERVGAVVPVLADDLAPDAVVPTASTTAPEPSSCLCPDPACPVMLWAIEQPRRVAVGPDGTVFVATRLQVSAYTPDGAFLRQWPAEEGSDWGDGTAGAPRDIAVAANGSVSVLLRTVRPRNMYLYAGESDTLVKTYDAAGNFATAWGRYGAEEWEFPPPSTAVKQGAWSLDVGPDGTVYVLDVSKNRVRRFDADGTFLGAWGTEGNSPGEFHDPQSIAVGPDGSVYILDTGNTRVDRFTAQGTLVTTWGREGPAAGEFHLPTGIAVGPDGTVYVADRGNNRIQRFAADGAFLGEFGFSAIGPPVVYDVAVAPNGLVYGIYTDEVDDRGFEPGQGRIEGFCLQPA
jgi:S1-C subfamily serine protease